MVPSPPVVSMAHCVRVLAMALALLTVAPGTSGARASRLCATLGDRPLGRPDVDTFLLVGHAEEAVSVVVEAAPGAAGGRVRLKMRGATAARAGAGEGDLPLSRGATLADDGALVVAVRQVRRGFTGGYCLGVVSNGAASTTLAATADVEVPWVALAADRGSVFPPFEPVTAGDWSGQIQPVLPLVGFRVYGLVVTTRVRDHAGHPLRADRDFATVAHVPSRHAGPVARFSADPEADANPYPDARLVRSDGTIHVPDRIALRGLEAADPALAAARADLRASADELGRLHGFSTVSPIELALSAPADIATVSPASVLFFERTDGRTDLDGLLAAARRQGIRRRDVALAVSFPTQEIEDGHLAVRRRLFDASLADFAPTLVDPDPTDDLAIGVFGPGDPEYAAILPPTPQVAKVVVGLLPSREFRGADGLFDPAVLAGTTPPRVVPIDFVLTIPASGTPPYPVVVFQHGFGGSDTQSMKDVAGVLADHGLAAIAISAVSHGRRGSFFDLLTGTGLELRDIFRQTNADQTSLVRMIEAGVDIDGDGHPDLDPDRIGYLGISLGGLVGGPFVATEPRIRAAVLNVMSGRTALNGLNTTTRPIFTGFLAMRVGLELGSAAFEAYLDREIALGEHAANEADSLNFARRWTHQPFRGYAPRRILIQEGVGDALVFNVLTEELAAVAGFASNVPASDPAGVSGHWIFQPPGGHGIFGARPEVRTQAAQFLASGGTEIIEP